MYRTCVSVSDLVDLLFTSPSPLFHLPTFQPWMTSGTRAFYEYSYQQRTYKADHWWNNENPTSRHCMVKGWGFMAWPWSTPSLTLTCSDKYGSFFRMLLMIRLWWAVPSKYNLGDEASLLHVILRHNAHAHAWYQFVSKVKVLFPLERLEIETSGTFWWFILWPMESLEDRMNDGVYGNN